MTLSSEEIADMDREVEDILHGIDETDDDESEPGELIFSLLLMEDWDWFFFTRTRTRIG